MSTVRRAWHGLLLALIFLTVVPLRLPADAADGKGTAPAFYAVVGALIGLAGGGVFAAAEPTLGPVTAAILAVAAMVVLTGGLHQDGLADCADGLGVRGDRERRLRVMRDPVIGSFGTVALILWGLLTTSALAQLSTRDAVGALVTAGAVSRWAALVHAKWAGPARADGLGASFSPTAPVVIAAGVTAVAAAILADAGGAGPAMLTGMLVAGATSVLARRAIGGRTGDTLGATVVLAEVSVLLVLLAIARG